MVLDSLYFGYASQTRLAVDDSPSWVDGQNIKMQVKDAIFTSWAHIHLGSGGVCRFVEGDTS